jgi:PKD repeat protein
MEKRISLIRAILVPFILVFNFSHINAEYRSDNRSNNLAENKSWSPSYTAPDFKTIESKGEINTCGVKPLFKFSSASCTYFFKDLTTVNGAALISGWEWDFGDGTTSDLQNPSHLYTAAGAYEVCLKVECYNETESCTQTYCEKINVNCNADNCGLKPGFTYRNKLTEVNFTDLSLSDSSNDISRWSWDFGDGKTSSERNPAHLYSSPGAYNVCLEVEGSDGKCRKAFCQPVNVHFPAEPCELRPFLGYEKQHCSFRFSDMSETGLSTGIIAWHWDFGDGIFSSVQHPSHTFAKPGVYNLCLTLTGSNGAEECRQTFCETVVAECKEPCAVSPEFTFSNKDCKVSFKNQTELKGGKAGLRWRWTFGDGDSTDIYNPVHHYKLPGNYNVCLLYRNDAGELPECNARQCREISVVCVQNAEPNRSDIPEVTVGPVPAVEFTSINLKLPENGKVEIIVTDAVSGKKVSEILNKELQAGNHSFTWDIPSDFPPGQYQILVSIPDKVFRHKLFLIR